jgi:SAM-dependent methyltransferase
MRNQESWRPSKFVLVDGTLRASRDQAEVGIRSRMVADVEAAVCWSALRKHATGILADVGCGKVPLYEVYKDLVSNVICIDWAHTWHGSSHLDIEADLNRGLPLPDSSVDTILCSSVLEHLRKPDLFWSEARRALRPGGKVIATVPFLYWLHEEPHDYYRFTKHQFRVVCEEHGLRVLEIQESGGPLCVILDIIGKNTPWLVAPYQAFACWLSKSRLGKRIDERGVSSFPSGYCVVVSKPQETESDLEN